MSNPKFTPGPWHVDGWDLSSVIQNMNPGAANPGWKHIVKCDYGYAEPEKHFEENHANAQLISAAPEMYEALKQAHETITWMIKNTQAIDEANNAEKWTIPAIAMDQISRAIEKAEGVTSND